MDEIDLDKLSEFVNSTEDISDVDQKEIENTINYIDSQLTEVKQNTKEVKTLDDIKKQENTVDSLTDIALKQFSKVDERTDEIYDLFYKPLALGRDRSDVSKQSLIESQRLKIESMNVIAALVNAKAKLEAAKTKVATGNVGVFVNTMDQGQVGINLHSLWENTKEET